MGESAVGKDFGADNESGIFGCEEDGRFADVGRQSLAAGWCHIGPDLFYGVDGVFGYYFSKYGRVDRAGRKGVYPDLARQQVKR